MNFFIIMSKRPFSYSSSNSPMTLAAIFVSLCALAVSVYQSYIFKNQQYATVWPYLEPRVEYTNNKFELFIQNKGTGPAILQNMKINLDGKDYVDYQLLLKDLLHVTDDAFKSMSISFNSKQVLSAGERVEVFTAEVKDSINIVSDFPQRTVLTICYCSIFGDCWKYVDGKVTKIKKCE